MPINDHPFDVLKRELELDQVWVSPVTTFFLKLGNLLSKAPLPKPYDKIFGAIKERLSAQSMERVWLFLETIMDEVRRVGDLAEQLYAKMTPEETQQKADAISELLLDGARKAEATRSKERIRRIGLILAGTLVVPGPNDADTVEEMMRIAMNLTDEEVRLLKELVQVTGGLVKSRGRIDRYQAHTLWENASWGKRMDSNLDSVFSKLESFGLVARIPPPNKLNINADFQNRYALLHKGLAFTEMIKSLSERNAQ